MKPSAQLLVQLSKVLQLSPVQEIVLGIALLNSAYSETRTHSANFVRHKLPHVLNGFIDAEESGAGSVKEVPIEIIHFLLTRILSSAEVSLISPDQKEGFLAALRRGKIC